MLEKLNQLTQKQKLYIGGGVVFVILLLMFASCGQSKEEKRAQALYDQQLEAAKAQTAAAQAQVAAAQAATQMVQQPQIVQTPPADSNLAEGMILGAAAYAAFDRLGNVRPGYTVIDGRVYDERNSYVRNYVKKNRIQPVKSVKMASTPAPVAAPVPAKVKNPGDAAAEAERSKMAAEAARKQDIANRRAALEASKAQRLQAASASKPSGFNFMSKSASSSPSRSSSFGGSSSRSSSSSSRSSSRR